MFNEEEEKRLWETPHTQHKEGNDIQKLKNSLPQKKQPSSEKEKRTVHLSPITRKKKPVIQNPLIL
jgi:hypothetical protein